MFTTFSDDSRHPYLCNWKSPSRLLQRCVSRRFFEMHRVTPKFSDYRFQYEVDLYDKLTAILKLVIWGDLTFILTFPLSELREHISQRKYLKSMVIFCLPTAINAKFSFVASYLWLILLFLPFFLIESSVVPHSKCRSVRNEYLVTAFN